MHCDVTDKESVDKMVADTVKELGKVDILVNMAGSAAYNYHGPIEELSVENWDKVVDVNLKSVFLCSTACAREMKKQKKGNIISIAAAMGHRCFAGEGAYGPAKSAVISLTMQMAVELAKYNIRVNGVSPGGIMNPATAEILETDRGKEILAKLPIARVATPQEIANAILFLASPDCEYMTGQSIIIDGGGILGSYMYP